ncbi:MAG: hypothetical protein AB8F74_16405 [Saprospiraceae bacterium]
MKKDLLRNFFLACLILVSLTSYIYLNTAVVGEDNVHQSALEAEINKEETKEEVMLPDVRVLKAIIEKGKDMLPAS